MSFALPILQDKSSTALCSTQGSPSTSLPEENNKITRITSLGRQLQPESSKSEEINPAQNPIKITKRGIGCAYDFQKSEHHIPADQLISTLSSCIASVKVNVKNYAIDGLNYPQNFERFLTLKEQNDNDRTSISLIEEHLRKIFVEDLDLFIKYSKHASNPNYPLIKKTWEEALEQLRKKTLKKFDRQLHEFYKKIFSYIAQTPPTDKMEINLIKKVLAFLFPYAVLYITDIAKASQQQEIFNNFTKEEPFELSKFIQQFCLAWSHLPPITLPSFKYHSNHSELMDEKKFIELLKHSQTLNEYPEVTKLLPILEKELCTLLESCRKARALAYILSLINHRRQEVPQGSRTSGQHQDD